MQRFRTAFIISAMAMRLREFNLAGCVRVAAGLMRLTLNSANVDYLFLYAPIRTAGRMDDTRGNLMNGKETLP